MKSFTDKCCIKAIWQLEDHCSHMSILDKLLMQNNKLSKAWLLF